MFSQERCAIGAYALSGIVQKDYALKALAALAILLALAVHQTPTDWPVPT
jgi:hypothetical protein